jgi:DNA-binding transcriptional regulator of glucitol operon
VCRSDRYAIRWGTAQAAGGGAAPPVTGTTPAGVLPPAVRVGCVYSRLLTPKWLLLHLLVAVLFVATFFLGYWQLTKAEAGGGAVNWSYALQWPLYGFMGLWFYLRMVKLELNRKPDDDAPGAAVVLYQRPRIDTSGDPELAAYNAYLAELNEKALGRRSGGNGR